MIDQDASSAELMPVGTETGHMVDRYASPAELLAVALAADPDLIEGMSIDEIQRELDVLRIEGRTLDGLCRRIDDLVAETSCNGTITKRRLLEQHPLFGRLQPEELDRLVAHMRVARYKRGTVLFRKGDPGTTMMVVLRGGVKVCTQSEDGKEVVHNLFSPGDVFGEIALLDGGDRTTDAVTLDASELLVLDRRDFIPFLRDHPDATLRLTEVLCQKLRQTSQRLEEALFLEGPSRLAKRLIHLAETHGKPVAEGIRIDLHLSQQDLGNIVGMSRESMNKHLRYWREEDLIRIEDGHYVITDIDALRAV